MKVILCTSAVFAAVLLPYASEAFAPAPGRTGECLVSATIKGNCQWQLRASADGSSVETKSLRSNLKRKSKPISFAIATAASFISCLPGQPSRQFLFRPAAAQASAPIVLRAAKPKDEPPMIQAMKKAEEVKKQRSMEDFDDLMQKLGDIEATEGKKARDAYEKQYETEKAAKEAQKAIDLENLKRDLLDEGKDPNSYLDAENEVFKFEHDVDLEKIPGTPHNEQMIKNFRSRGKNKPTYESQRYIVKCQVEDLKARGVDPLAHFSQPEVIEKTRAIYKMDDKVAEKVANQYAELMEQYGGRLTPVQEGETPFVRPGTEEKVVSRSPGPSKEERAANKAALKAKRASEKVAAKKEKAAQKQARIDAKAKARADKAAAKGMGSSKVKPSKEVAVVAPSLSNEPALEATEAPTQQKETKSVLTATKTKKAPRTKSIASFKKKLPVKEAAVIVVCGGAAAVGYKFYSDASVAKRNEQYRNIMGGGDDDDDYDDDDDDEY